jgi:hypothetical protein
MCIKDYEIEIGGQGPVRAIELLEKKLYYYMSVILFPYDTSVV